MDRFPEYKFVASQAQQFKWLLEDHPEFFNKVLIPKIQQSQFFAVGGTWVENDTNIPSGESLARQFFFGQRFFLSILVSSQRYFGYLTPLVILRKCHNFAAYLVLINF